MKKFLCLLLLITSVLVSINLQAQEPVEKFDYAKGGEFEIADIKVVGAKYLDARILVTLSGLAKGDKIKLPGEQIPKAIKALWKQKLFTDIQVDSKN